ncbi:hypothetical protein BJY16_008533 [Actinoplanes octamycinicus]|uniref:CHAT domain-containing protein n=1 Tax=Actinoplanes octamycinicus TaxID=135948 RepID=A0A7W7H6Z2_9ACTN|nr:hypothetical protein [Actinoplanes octamycinicus]MBB4745074.1 hypothetical protein [Actinoplanes octamycinicus]GIE55660.1 hypothetical protein Aoc01nite_10620 [Actinoplanes octamycinicus]
MYDDRITALRALLARRTGPARFRPLAELGQLLAARAWQTGIGTTAAKPDVDAAVEALTEARTWSDPDDTHRYRLAAVLGTMLAGRSLAYGGPDTDRELAIEVLEESQGSPAVHGPVDDSCRLFLGLLLISRAVAPLHDSELLLTAVRTRTPLPGTADVDRATGLFRTLIENHPESTEIGRLARTSLTAAEAMRDLVEALGRGGQGLDFNKMISAMQRLKETPGPAGGGLTVPMPSFLDVEAVLNGDALDYPVAVVTSPPSAPSPATSSPAGPSSAGAAPATPSSGSPSAAAASRAVPRQRAATAAAEVEALRRAARDRLVRGAGLWTAVATRLLPDAPPLSAAVVDDLAAISAAVLHRGGTRSGDHVLAAFARYQRSRLTAGLAGEWDDDLRMAGRHLLDAAGQLPAAPADLVAVTCALAGLLDERYPTGAVLTGLANRLAPVLEAVHRVGAQALAVPQPGGCTLLGATEPDRVIALGRRPLRGHDGIVSYVPTAATLIDLSQRPRPTPGRRPVFLGEPTGDAATLYDAFYRDAAPADRLVVHLDAHQTPEERHGLAILADPSGTGFPDRADALLAAGLTSVIGWHRPVPAEVAAPALFALHHHLLTEGRPPAVAVHLTHQWLRDPARPEIPGLPPAWSAALTGPAAHSHAAALVLRGI